MNVSSKRAVAITVAVAVFAIASIAIARAFDLGEVIAFARSVRSVWWLPIAYVAAYVLLAILCVPPQLLSILAPIVWGWRLGSAIELVAATVGAIPPYLIARSALRLRVAKRMGEQRVDNFALLLIFRLVPVIPYSLLNYIAGLSAITPGAYVAASAIGMIPSIVIFAYFVDAVAAGLMKPSEVLARAVIAGAILAVFVVATRLAARVVKPPARGASTDREDAPPAIADRESP